MEKVTPHKSFTELRFIKKWLIAQESRNQFKFHTEKICKMTYLVCKSEIMLDITYA